MYGIMYAQGRASQLGTRDAAGARRDQFVNERRRREQVAWRPFLKHRTITIRQCWCCGLNFCAKHRRRGLFPHGRCWQMLSEHVRVRGNKPTLYLAICYKNSKSIAYLSYLKLGFHPQASKSHNDKLSSSELDAGAQTKKHQ